MKVCHVTSIHERYDTRIFQKECVSLVEAGYEVYLLVNDERASETREGVHIVSTGTVFKTRTDRFINLKSKMKRHLLEINADVYHFHDPDLLPIGIYVKRKRKNTKIIFDSHEDIPGQIMGKEWIPFFLRRVISFSFKIYQHIVLKKYDYIISVSPNIVEKLRKISDKVEMVTNYPIVRTGSEDNRMYAAEETNSICFAGGISSQWCHEAILDAIEGMEVNFILCGKGEESYLTTLKEKKAWNKVKYLGVIPFEQVSSVYRESQVGMAIIEYSFNTGGKQGTLGNTKLFEYMQAGLPVICTDFVYWKEIVEKNRCGICVDPCDVGQIREALRYLLNNPTLAKEMGENGKRVVNEKYNWETQVEKLVGVYEKLLGI